MSTYKLKEVLNMKVLSDAKLITLMGILAVLLVVFSFTPIGSIPVGPLCITLNVIPVAIAAVISGPIGGAVMGGIFGLLSYMQCFGIGVPSTFGAIIVENNAFFAFIVCVVTRFLAGLFAGMLNKYFSKKINPYVSSLIAGFSTALLNTMLFMTSLVLLFGQTEYLQKIINGQNIFIFICTFVGVNAIVEIVTATVITGAISTALYKTKLVDFKKQLINI